MVKSIGAKFLKNSKYIKKAIGARGVLLTLLAFLFFGIASAAETRLEEADALANKGAYKEAYEKLLLAVKELQSELENLQGLVEYYKEEVAKLSGGRPQVIDYKYNEAANRLWASAWRMQHDGIFKKMGREKEEYLQKAIDTFKRIVIDYPYADKAEEAQYRVGRIYYRFLKEYELAEIELQRYLNMYPKGKYASDARGMLRRIRRE